ncbi:MAG TPA: hypothetical protein DCY07_04135 [Rhodospirillaceae bacterium]|nr:hypothetical protein [Rhodospirillaceae bacterium]
MNAARALNYNLITPQVVVLPFGKGKKGKVSNADQPVRDIVPTATIYAGTRGIQPPKGTVYTATFLDGTKREIFVEIDADDGKQYFDNCHFLKEGRTGTLISEIRKLKIIDYKDRPSHHIIERMKKDAVARGELPASIPSVS